MKSVRALRRRAPAGRSWRWRRALGRPFGEIDFVIVDVETTGWSPEDAVITEIGAVRVSGGLVRAQFSALVNPGSAIPAPVTELTGISDAMAAAAPPLAGVLARFLGFSRGCVLTAHNAPFDIGFLTAACKSCDLPWPKFAVLDTVELARLVLAEGEVADCKLATLADFFGAGTAPRHRALADALATADVLTSLLARLSTAGVRTLAEAGCGQAGYGQADRRPARDGQRARHQAGATQGGQDAAGASRPVLDGPVQEHAGRGPGVQEHPGHEPAHPWPAQEQAGHG